MDTVQYLCSILTMLHIVEGSVKRDFLQLHCILVANLGQTIVKHKNYLFTISFSHDWYFVLFPNMYKYVHISPYVAIANDTIINAIPHHEKMGAKDVVFKCIPIGCKYP